MNNDTNKYITQIEFTLTSNNAEKFILNFGKGINILIGPKGGGKSTLLNAIHYIHNKMKPNSSVNNALKENGFEVTKIIYSDNTIQDIKNADKHDAKKEFFDIIKQDDKLKTQLNETEVIKKEKEEFTKSLFNHIIKVLSEWFQEYFESFQQIKENYSNHIKWPMIGDLFNKKSHVLGLLLNTFTIDLNSKNIDNKNYRNLIILNEIYSEYLKEYEPVLYQDYKNIFDILLEQHKTNFKNINNKKYCLESYKKTLNIINKKINDKNSNEGKYDSQKNSIKEFVKNVAKNLAINHVNFQFFKSGEIEFRISKCKKTDFNLEFKIDKNFSLTDVDQDSEEAPWYIDIIEEFLYSPTNKKTHWSNWVKTAIFVKDTPIKKADKVDDKIKEKLSNFLKEKIQNDIKLIADGKDYNTMSLGTRTSYGLKHKINSFNSNIIFLDQPEDNLDNYTVYKELLNLLKDGSNRKITQIFLVTHNSNLGALTSPATITTCKLTKNKFNESYIQKTDLLSEVKVSEQNSDSPVLHYLEGGKESLIERENVLIKNKKEN